MAAEIKIGDIIRCKSEGNLPDVDVWIAKLETFGDLGITDSTGTTKIVHVQLVGVSNQDMPPIGHSPFSHEAIDLCTSAGRRQGAALTDGFNEGYQIWLKAFHEDKAGIFTISPAQAYWFMLGVLDENGVRVQ